MGPSLYALTWMPIDDLRGKIDSGATTVPSHNWAKWSPASAPQKDQSTENHQDCRQTNTGLPADQKTQFIGTARSPPSRSRWEGHHDTMATVSRMKRPVRL